MIDRIKDHMKKYDMNYSISIKNFKTGEAFNVNESVAVTSASTIKVFIMAEALRQIKRKGGQFSLNNRISILKDDKVPYSIITMLDPENTYTIKDLITLMIVQSDNTATNILIDLLGIDNINLFLKSLGYKNTVLQRKMMDIEARRKGFDNMTSAKELTDFMELLYKGKIVDEKSSKMMIEIMKLQLDNSMMRLFIPDEVVIAHKTGELDCIDHDTGIVYTGKGDYVFTMMTWDAKSNNEARFAIGEVSKIVYDYFINK